MHTGARRGSQPAKFSRRSRPLNPGSAHAFALSRSLAIFNFCLCLPLSWMLKTPGGCGERGGEEPAFERRLTSHEAHLLLQVYVLPGSNQKELLSLSSSWRLRVPRSKGTQRLHCFLGQVHDILVTVGKSSRSHDRAGHSRATRLSPRDRFCSYCHARVTGGHVGHRLTPRTGGGSKSVPSTVFASLGSCSLSLPPMQKAGGSNHGFKPSGMTSVPFPLESLLLPSS